VGLSSEEEKEHPASPDQLDKFDLFRRRGETERGPCLEASSVRKAKKKGNKDQRRAKRGGSFSRRGRGTMPIKHFLSQS